MSVLKVLTVPDSILKQKAREVETVDDSVRAIMNDMLATLYKDKGVGLAANQVGVLKRIMVIDVGEDDDIQRPEGFYPLFIANPVITSYSSEPVEAEEGCLSVPDQRINIARAYAIELDYLDYNNDNKSMLMEGWLARVVQHELDHLNGKVIIDYLSPVKKDIVLRKLTKMKKSV